MEHLVSSSLLIGPGRLATSHATCLLRSSHTSARPLHLSPSAPASTVWQRSRAQAACQTICAKHSRRYARSAAQAGVGHASSSSNSSSRADLRSRRLMPLSASFFTSRRIDNAGILAGSPDASTSNVLASSAVPSAEEALSELRRKYAPRTDDPSITFLQTATASLPNRSLFRPLPLASVSTTINSWRSLAKSRLTFLMVLTGMAGYALVPAPLAASSTSVVTLLALTAGMTLCSSSANSMNQFLEAPYDAQMMRTRARPLPSRQVTHLHAFTYSVATGVSGTALLASMVNPLTAVLGAANVVLYAGIYTPMKRLAIGNTWVGAIVGAIPPLMGWVASTGTLFAPTDAPAWLLAGILFAWQFPHFNSLAHNVRADYAKGGYRMMSVLNPALNRRTALRYAVALVPLCSALPVCAPAAIVPAYAIMSLIPNAALLQAAWRFYRVGGEKEARKCFFVSLWHLPVVLLLAMACKRDIWEALGLVAPVSPVQDGNTVEASVQA